MPDCAECALSLGGCESSACFECGGACASASCDAFGCCLFVGEGCGEDVFGGDVLFADVLGEELLLLSDLGEALLGDLLGYSCEGKVFCLLCGEDDV